MHIGAPHWASHWGSILGLHIGAPHWGSKLGIHTGAPYWGYKLGITMTPEWPLFDLERYDEFMSL